MMAFTLTRAERWILSNQYRILERLDQTHAADYAATREALERGYELEYEDAARDIETHTLSVDACGDVLDALSLYQHLQQSCRVLPEPSGFDPRALAFPGFDGNHESAHLSYCEYFCAKGRFRGLDLACPGDYNSHSPTLEMYRRMVAVWKPMRRGGVGWDGRLSREQVGDILLAQIHPDSPAGQLQAATPEGSVQ